MNSKAPSGNNDPKWDLEDQAQPVISQKVMNIVSVLLVLSLIFGSMTVAVVLADQRMEIALLVGLAVAVTLLVGWLVMRISSSRRR